MCAGSKGRAMCGGGSCLSRERDHKGEGAVLGAPSTASVMPQEDPRNNHRKIVLWAFWGYAHREH